MGIPLPPPWVLLSLMLGFSKNIQDVKDLGSLTWSIVRGREDAGCGLCNKLVKTSLAPDARRSSTSSQPQA